MAARRLGQTAVQRGPCGVTHFIPSYSLLATLALTSASLACTRPPGPSVDPLSQYGSPEASLPHGVVPSSRGGVVIGVITSSCKGEPVQALVRIISAAGDTTAVRSGDRGGFVAGPLSPGAYEFRFLAIAFEPFRRTATLAVRRIDTLRVVLKFNDALVIADCIGPDGRFFGPQFCPPRGHAEC
jgi:hypothetical protein